MNKEKEKVFVNLSNHPSSDWTESQLKAAERYGEVIDLAFPTIQPDADEQAVSQIADQYVAMIRDISKDKSVTLHIMGEMTFVFKVVSQLNVLGITCVASTTERIAYETDAGKLSEFHFVRFRKYNS
jgi:hypothetical protein